MRRILVLDNYDSFTYNLVHLLEELRAGDVTVRRNDKLSLGDVEAFDRIVLSPGPGIPNEAGIMPEVVREFGPRKPILGVCLGHQCIAEQFGATLVNMPRVVHGKKTLARIEDPADPLFAGLPSEIEVGRYHSWAVADEGLPACLKVTARSVDGIIQALRHSEHRVFGVQFHPESVLTSVGPTIVQNWLNCA